MRGRDSAATRCYRAIVASASQPPKPSAICLSLAAICNSPSDERVLVRSGLRNRKNSAAERLHYPLAGGQPETAPFVLRGRVQAVKRLENGFVVLRLRFPSEESSPRCSRAGFHRLRAAHARTHEEASRLTATDTLTTAGYCAASFEGGSSRNVSTTFLRVS